MCKNLILGTLAMMVLIASMAQGGTLSVVDLPATGTDDAIDINSGKIYTHTFDFGSNAPVTINGVDFEQGPTAGLSSVYTGTSSWGYGYTIDDTRRPVNIPTHPGGGVGTADTPADGDSMWLFRDFIYHSGGPVGDGTILTLSDLTAGTTYSMRWYYGPFGIGAGRVITFEADGESNGIFSDTIELSLDTGGAHYLDYTFTADDTDVTLRFITHNDNQSAHIYGLSNEIAVPVTKAYGPTPKDGAQYTDTWISLSWKPGAYAVSHDVYMGENFDDVNDGAGDTFRGSQDKDAVYFVAGFTGYAYPDGLVPGTTYYWRIDEVNEADPNSPWKGPVWSFWIPSKKAYEASPADGALFIDPNVTLTWTAGFESILHTVYFGENFDEVNNAVEGPSQVNTTYTPGTLELEKTYYWRVDEVDSLTTHKGDVWSFKTLPDVQITDPNLVGWWKLDEGNGATTVDWSGYGNHGAITNTGGGLGENSSVWDTDPERGIVLSFNGNNSTGAYVIAGGIPEMTLTNDFTWTFWTKQHPDQSTDVTVGGNDLILGNRYSHTGADPLEFIKFTPAKFEFYNDDPDYLMTVDYDDIPSSVWIHHAGVKKGTTLTYYRNGVESGASTITKTIQANPFYMAGEPAGGGRWQGWLSDVQLYDKALTLDEIQQVMRGDPLLAWNANPVNGSTPYIAEAATLSWSPGDNASQHDVYFGIDKDAVTNADASDTTGIYRGRQNAAVYISSDVEWGGGPYYWRIDEYNIDETISKGKVWSFTVTDFIGIDNFENYDAGENQIWYAWKDGLGYGAPGVDPYFAGNGTGAAVGDETTASYTEETIVHGGLQSMPLVYDNNKQGYAMYSEVEHTLTDQRDWTEEGVTELSLWFRGNPASVGSFVESPAGTYTMTASGADIWNAADEFHYASKILSGAGSIVARVESVEQTDNWAKAGVMIRETLGAGSKFAAVYITPTNADGTATNGCRFQARTDTDAGATSDSDVATAEQTAIVAPYWVKLERDVGGNFRGYYSSNGSTWQSMSWNPQSISMGSNVYVGLALTSHDAALTCQAVFTNVTTTGTVGQQWANQDIGIESNAAEPLYVAISNSTGAPAVVIHDDPAAATIDIWTEWVIPLQAFADQGISLNNVDRIAIGLGTKDNMTVPGGSGKMYFDDIRLYQPSTAP